jgi:hypothetical protein
MVFPFLSTERLNAAGRAQWKMVDDLSALFHRGKENAREKGRIFVHHSIA